MANIAYEPAYESRTPARYWDCGWFSYLTFGWVNPLVETGIQRQVRLEDTPELADSEDALVNTRALSENLNDAERSRKSHPLLRALAITFWAEFSIMQMLRVAAHFLGLLNPILMAKVLVFQERQNEGQELTGEEKRNGFESVSALIALGFFMVFYNAQMQFYQNRLGVRMGSALRGAVLFRCIQGERGVGNTRTTGPSAYNVLSFDIDPIVDIIWIILAVWLFPIQFISTMVVLFQHVGWAVVPGLTTIIIVKIFCGVLLYQDGVLRHRLLTAKDKRLRLCNEGFNNIRTLHMLAWRGVFDRQIMDARVHELHAQKMRLWMTKMVAAMDYSLGMIVTFVTLAYYVVHMGGDLKASVALPVITLITNLTGPIGQFPLWMNQYMVWHSAYGRLSAFIGLVNRPNVDDSSADDSSDPPPPRNVADGRGGGCAFADCTLAWCSPPLATKDNPKGQPLLEQTGFELQSLDVGVRAGELLVVLGLEGQGKSSVLFGLLGEMTVKSGTAYSPAIVRHSAETRFTSFPGLTSSVKASRKLACEEKDAIVNPMAVPFSAQNAMLFTGSIRWNILFGAPYQSSLYNNVLRACALEEDLASMPAGDLTEVAQAGATLSGGQKRRISLARAVYRAGVALQQQPGITPLVLLDDPLCSLDKKVAEHVSEGLFDPAIGLLASCAVVVATADPWWVGSVQRRIAPQDQSTSAAPSTQGNRLQVALLRNGHMVAQGSLFDVERRGFSELEGLADSSDTAAGQEGAHSQGQGLQLPQPPVNAQSNPQGDDDDEVEQAPEEPVNPGSSSSPVVSKMADSQTQTELTEAQREALHVVKEEERDEGQVGLSTYKSYLSAVGTFKLVLCAFALTGIMVFQNLCNLWITYWTTEKKSKSFVYTSLKTVGVTPPTQPHQLLHVFACLVACFTLCNFAGHAMEIIGGISAAKKLFKQALSGTFDRPFRFWDANPTGRVLNRFSEDVMVMDAAITNIMGVIFGAVLYFVGHAFILALSNPYSLLLLPPIAAGLEYYARYYRMTIREVHRIFRVRMGLLYQDMIEAITGRVTVRSFAREGQVMEATIDNLDRYQQVAFCKLSLALWLGLRMAAIGYILSFWTMLRPILQYYGWVGKQSAALVGFSMTYSTETVGIIQQFVTNFSDLEMQLISIERLSAYNAEQERQRQAQQGVVASRNAGLELANVTVTYREGLLPALVGVSLSFSPGEVAAIMGRTGAGKSSLLLSILQLVPYEGNIFVHGQSLRDLGAEDVRRRLVGVVPQQPVLFDGNLRWNLDPEESHSDEDLWAALAAVGLEAKCREAGGLTAAVPGSDADAASEESVEAVSKVDLSQGQQQLLCAARALLRQPKVAMLDEVAASLPAEAATSMVSALVGRFKALDATVLMVTHQESLLACCERVVRLAGGRIVGDSRS